MHLRPSGATLGPMKLLIVLAAPVAAAAALAGCGSSDAPAAPSIRTFTVDQVDQDVMDLVPQTYPGTVVALTPECDSPLRAVGDVSLCETVIGGYAGDTFGNISHRVSVTLVDGNGHVRIKVEN